MPRQAVYFTDETLERLKDHIREQHGNHRALSLTIQQAIKEYLERFERREPQEAGDRR